MVLWYAEDHRYVYVVDIVEQGCLSVCVCVYIYVHVCGVLPCLVCDSSCINYCDIHVHFHGVAFSLSLFVSCIYNKRPLLYMCLSVYVHLGCVQIDGSN